ncbi:MAG: hypothetical protein HXS48_03815 [Theionarchaea archaeon]|nr:hypothetical protein [Theionarchaea archaeon]
MNRFSISAVATTLACATIIAFRWYRSPKTEGFGAIQYIVERPCVITLMFLISGFGTVRAFYWFRRPQQNE